MRRKARWKQTAQRLRKQAESLEARQIPSEVWFRKLYALNGASEPGDKFNYPFYPYICDMVNMQYRFIIEIDGSTHLTAKERAHDAKRDAFFAAKGFDTYRIRAFSIEDFNDTLKKVARRKVTIEPETGVVLTSTPLENFIDSVIEGTEPIQAIRPVVTILRKNSRCVA